MALDPSRLGNSTRPGLPAGPGGVRRPETREAPMAGRRQQRRRLAPAFLDPFDLDGAFERLEQLLVGDRFTGGPREDAPARGFYLNILV
jgi:hypothetical protein